MAGAGGPLQDLPRSWKCDEVAVGICVGGKAAARLAIDAFQAGETRFGSIINVSDKVFYSPRHASLHFHHEPMDDFGGTDLTAELLTRCFDAIDVGLQSACHRTLVHCTLGVNRSVTIVAAYLICRRGHTPESALAQIVRIRPRADPVQAYCAALQALPPAAVLSRRNEKESLDQSGPGTPGKEKSGIQKRRQSRCAVL
eukprot:m.329498 g.329498  ORF g.329498 m.329498 type:complete len:199 (+) comp16509_c1_seq5:1736-2332(+)